MRHREHIQKMSNEDLTKSVILTQVILIFLSTLLSFFLFSSIKDWFNYFHGDLQEILYYGLIPGVLIVSINLLLMFFVPKKYYDDGGINERIFQNKSVQYIFFLVLFIAIAEELLFRGVIQSTFGYIFASSLFALIHYRYLRKPLLLVAIIGTSFYLGYLFVITENLYVTITTHFIVNFILGLVIRYQN